MITHTTLNALCYWLGGYIIVFVDEIKHLNKRIINGNCKRGLLHYTECIADYCKTF